MDLAETGQAGAPAGATGRNGRSALQLRATAHPTAIAAASAWIRSLAARLKLAPGDAYRLDLCVSEIVTNATQYGYAGRRDGTIEIDAAPAADGAQVSVEITDDGEPFDPLSAPPPVRPSDIAQVEAGGLGIHLVRAYADECRYERRSGRNVFTFVVRRSSAPGRGAGGGPVNRGVERRRARAPAAFPVTRAGGIVVARDERAGTDRRLLGFISGCRLFRDVSYSLIEDVVAQCAIRDFEEGTVFLRPGERNHHVVLVVQGAIRVQLGSDEAPDYMEIVAGECAGEMSVIDGKPVSARVVAASACRLLLIDGETFVTRILPIPEVARNLVATLAERMRHSNERIIGQMKSSIELDGLQRDLHFAHQVQASMVPGRTTLAPERAEVQCCAMMRPAHQVGGDFYDALYIERDRLALMVGDVCGKGMPAALFMSRTMTLLRSEAMQSGSRAQRQHTMELVTRVNRQLCRGNEAGYFASVFVAILDVSTGLMTWVNAGHPAPLMARGSGELKAIAGPRGILLGVADDTAYSVGESALPPGSTLLVYSDGVTEAEDPDGRQFGDARLATLLAEVRNHDAAAIVDATVDAVDRFTRGHPRSDDLTLLALRYYGAP